MRKLLTILAALLISFTYGCQEPVIEEDPTDQTEQPSDDKDDQPSEDNGDKPSDDKDDQPSEDNGDKPSEDNGDQPSDDNGDNPSEGTGNDSADGDQSETPDEGGDQPEITVPEGHMNNNYGYQEEVAEPNYNGMTHVEFEESDKLFANPERGFYKHYDFQKASSSSLSVTTLKADRMNNITLCYNGYYLSEFMNSDISEAYLNLIRKNMQALRDAGVKCLLRFAYTTDASDSNKSKWDAKPEIVQRHIQNLKPIVQEYSDVILSWQAGFVGVWGEWYYTKHFVMEPSTPEQHQLRKEVTNAMLDALPQDRTISLRTPMFKRMMYAQNYTDTLTSQTAYSGSALSRIAAFNDCFGASEDDYGTFSGNQTREYWKKDTRYVLMGGETCKVSNYCTCKASLKDMEDYHWTYMNSGYNSDVLNRWESSGCMDEVKRRLGYRLSLSDVYHSEIAAGETVDVVLRIKNSGFAAPMNPRAVELVLVDGKGTKTVYEIKDVDPRFWFANKTSIINKSIKIPAGASGKCTLYLNLPDPKPVLRNKPEFSIRLANEDVWESATGYNKVLEFTL